MIHRYWLVAACIIIFGVRESSAAKECYELLWYPNTYDLPRGLALGNHSSSPSSAAVELSGRRVLPFLDISPPSWGGLPFLISPSWRGSIFFFFLVFGGGLRRRVIDGESDDAWRRELFRVPLAFLVFSGTV